MESLVWAAVTQKMGDTCCIMTLEASTSIRANHMAARDTPKIIHVLTVAFLKVRFIVITFLKLECGHTARIMELRERDRLSLEMQIPSTT